MTEMTTRFHEIQVVLGFIAILLFIYGPWQWFIIDLARQRLFEIRDRLFDSARAEEIDFHDEKYTLTRNFINSALRFTEHTSFMRSLFISRVFKEYETPKELIRLNEICNNKDNPRVFKDSYESATKWIAISMWLRSPVFIVLTILIAALLPVIAFIAMISDNLKIDLDKTTDKLGREIQREVLTDLKFSS